MHTFTPLSCSCVNLSGISVPSFIEHNTLLLERSSLGEQTRQVLPLQTQLTHPSDGAALWPSSHVLDWSANVLFWRCAHFNRSACVFVHVCVCVCSACVCYLVRVGPECWNGELSLDPAFSNGIRCIPHRVTLRASIHLQAVRTNTHIHKTFLLNIYLLYIYYL